MTELLDKTVDQKLVNLTIDEVSVTVPEGTLVVEAARTVDIDIPVFCYHPKLEPVGMCRMCLVDIGLPMRDRATGEPMLEEDGSPKIQFGRTLQTGCTIKVSEGMVVVGYTETVKKARQDVVEFLLTSHPLDCPVCDKGGECPLQNMTLDYGVGESRFVFEDKIRFAKNVPLGDLIYLDRERCIQCARCTRFQTDIADDPVIGFNQRGRSLEIVTLSEPGFDSYWSGNTTDICPVGALTTADFRFGARPWEMKTAASICNQCAVGCNTAINTRREAKSGGNMVIKRVMPRQNELVNEIWMCDKGRFAYPKFAEGERITAPMIRKGEKLVEASWEEAIGKVAEKMKEAGKSTSIFAGGRLSSEDYFMLNGLASHFDSNAILDSNMAGGDLVTQFGVGKGTNFADLGKGDAIVVVASDLEEEAPLWWMRAKQAAERGATLIVANPRTTKTDAKATYSIRYQYGQEAAFVQALASKSGIKGINSNADVKSLENDKQLVSAAQVLKDAENVIVLYGSEGLDLAGSQDLAQSAASLLNELEKVGKANSGLIAVWDAPNAIGAWMAGLRPNDDVLSTLKKSDVAYLVAVDFAGDSAKMAKVLESTDFVVVQEVRMTKSAMIADVVFPAQSNTEREGSYVSGERRMQRFYPAIPAPEQTKADYLITAMIANSLELSLVHDSVAKVFAEFVGGETTFEDLAKIEPQWPIIGREDVNYGGTSYNNTQGMGAQNPSGQENGNQYDISFPALAPAPSYKELTAMPITKLYDRGNTIKNSQVLASRLVIPFVEISEADALALKLESDAKVTVQIDGALNDATVIINSELSKGVVLVPRSVGFAISGPTPITIKAN